MTCRSRICANASRRSRRSPPFGPGSRSRARARRRRRGRCRRARRECPPASAGRRRRSVRCRAHRPRSRRCRAWRGCRSGRHALLARRDGEQPAEHVRLAAGDDAVRPGHLGGKRDHRDGEGGLPALRRVGEAAKQLLDTAEDAAQRLRAAGKACLDARENSHRSTFSFGLGRLVPATFTRSGDDPRRDTARPLCPVSSIDHPYNPMLLHSIPDSSGSRPCRLRVEAMRRRRFQAVALTVAGAAP